MKVKLAEGQSVPSASAKLGVVIAVGLAVALLVGLAVSWKLAPLIAWDTAALTYMATTWRRILKFDAGLVKKHALREDPSRPVADVVLVVASIVSLAAVGLVLSTDQNAGAGQVIQPVLSVLSVVVSWLMIHTVYALRYAEMYYRSPQGGVDFSDTTDPTYLDFAYLAFTLGMTYQVSDTSLKTRAFRAIALKHTLLSYLFGTVIVATTINLVAGLGK
jgi:uncharacterized membrane protein